MRRESLLSVGTIWLALGCGDGGPAPGSGGDGTRLAAQFERLADSVDAGEYSPAAAAYNEQASGEWAAPFLVACIPGPCSWVLPSRPARAPQPAIVCGPGMPQGLLDGFGIGRPILFCTASFAGPKRTLPCWWPR
jgi:hypothetical protein